jgi:hypothetical protein
MGRRLQSAFSDKVLIEPTLIVSIELRNYRYEKNYSCDRYTDSLRSNVPAFVSCAVSVFEARQVSLEEKIGLEPIPVGDDKLKSRNRGGTRSLCRGPQIFFAACCTVSATLTDFEVIN